MIHDPASLRLDAITVNFGGLTALSKVSIEINPGEVVGLIGPNGAGKTTLFNVFSGLVTPDAGTFLVDGKVRHWPEPHQLTAHRIGRTLQGVGLFNELTVLENLLVGATHLERGNLFKSLMGITSASEKQSLELAKDVLKKLEIVEFADHLAGSLSYPISKRVALARALMCNPATLLLDEPAGGLGQEDIQWLKEFVITFRATGSVLLVEHHMDVIMSVCDRIYVLDFGELIAHGSPEEIRNDPAVIAAYLGSEVDS